jgi:hypothetical protein
MSEGTLVFSNTGLTSANGAVSIGRHTDSIRVLNTHATTDAIVKLNGGPLTILAPAINSGGGYLKIDGDYTTIEVLTANVTVSVMAFG